MKPTGYEIGYKIDTRGSGGTEKDPAQLDHIFAALAHPTRRDLLVQLGQGSANVTELAGLYDISQPAISKHLRVLEKAGLISRGIDQQRRPAQLNATNLAAAVAWLEQFASFWEGSLDQLDALLHDLNDNTRNPANE